MGWRKLTSHVNLKHFWMVYIAQQCFKDAFYSINLHVFKFPLIPFAYNIKGEFEHSNQSSINLDIITEIAAFYKENI